MLQISYRQDNTIFQNMNERSLLLSKVFSVSSCQKLAPKKFYHTPPSFSTEAPVSKVVTQLPPVSAVSVFFTGSPDWPYTDLRKHVNLPQFYEGISCHLCFAFPTDLSSNRLQAPRRPQVLSVEASVREMLPR